METKRSLFAEGSGERQYKDCGWGKNLNQHGCFLVSEIRRGISWGRQKLDHVGPWDLGRTFIFYSKCHCTTLSRGMMWSDLCFQYLGSCVENGYEGVGGNEVWGPHRELLRGRVMTSKKRPLDLTKGVCRGDLIGAIQWHHGDNRSRSSETGWLVGKVYCGEKGWTSKWTGYAVDGELI